jgi:glycosyltransferase involved in cell wall biosynthesis
VPSYRVPVFRELYNRFGIITCHSIERKNASWRSFADEMEYPNELIPILYYRKKETSAIQNIFPVLFKYKPSIIISEFSLAYLTFWLLWLLKPFLQYKLILWTHGVKNNEIYTPFVNRSRKFYLKIIDHADAAIIYSEHRKQILTGRIKNQTKLFVATNTLDTSGLKVIYDEISSKGKDTIKKEVGFLNKYNLIFTGRLLKDKRIDLILDSFALLSKNFDVALHFIGDGPEQELISEYSSDLTVINHGAIFEEGRIGKFLYASDLYLMPGYIGLGIVHAFAFGLPVISCKSTENGPFHSPEAEYLVDGINGLWCDSTASSIAAGIIKCLTDSKIMGSMSLNAYKTAYNTCSIDQMMTGFKEAINYCRSL